VIVRTVVARESLRNRAVLAAFFPEIFPPVSEVVAAFEGTFHISWAESRTRSEWAAPDAEFLAEAAQTDRNKLVDQPLARLRQRIVAKAPRLARFLRCDARRR
jgi:hypothetical protein